MARNVNGSILHEEFHPRIGDRLAEASIFLMADGVPEIKNKE